MAVLAGDFLLANACTGLARLGSTRVVQLIANAISHLMEARSVKRVVIEHFVVCRGY